MTYNNDEATLAVPEKPVDEYRKYLDYLIEVARIRSSGPTNLRKGNTPDHLPLDRILSKGTHGIYHNDQLEVVSSGNEIASETFDDLIRLVATANNEDPNESLRLGLGIYHYLEDDNPKEYPVFTFPLEAKNNLGTIKLSPLPNGKWQCEKGMLRKIKEHGGPKSLRKLENQLNAQGDTFSLSASLRLLEEKLDPGHLLDSLVESPTKTRAGKIELSYLLLTQKRSLSNLANFLESARDRTKNWTLPNFRSQFPLMIPFVEGEITPPSPLLEKPFVPTAAANREQLKIANALQKSDLVLVQGPPGTGKSYTIAHLIGQFLAERKSVLVTAEKPTAIAAVRKYLPEELKDLVIYDDGGEELTRSARRFAEVLTDFDQEHWNRICAQNNHRLAQIEVESKRLKKRLAEDPGQQIIHLNEKYNGKLSDLMERILHELPEYSWFNDPIDKAFNLGSDHHDRLVKDFVRWHRYMIELWKHAFVYNSTFVPDLSILLTPDELRRYEKIKAEFQGFIPSPLTTPFAKLTAAVEAYESWSEAIPQEEWFLKNGGLSIEEAERIINLMTPILTQIDNLNVPDLLTNYGCTSKVPTEISAHLQKIDGKLILFPQYRAAKDDFVYAKQKQLRHSERPDVLKRFYQLHNGLDRLATAWEMYDLPLGGTEDLLLIYQQRLEVLNTFVREYKNAKPHLRTLSDGLPVGYNSLLQPNLNPEVRIKYRKTERGQALNELHQKRERSIIELERGGPRPTAVMEALDAIETADQSLYFDAYEGLRQLQVLKEIAEKAEALKETLLPSFRETMQRIRSKSADRPITELALNEAIYFHHARTTLINKLQQARHQRVNLLNELNQERYQLVIENYFSDCVSKILIELESVSKAALALVNWAELAAKSKGTGKKALGNKAKAREKLRELWHFIPAYFATVDRLSEAVAPDSNLFDLTIVDEASQLSVAAVSLCCISNRLIALGDQRQVSPVYAGVNTSSFDELRKKYLENTPNQERYDRETSFFDLINLSTGFRPRLREHYRCLPEIISFSDQLCYADKDGKNGLLPLRKPAGLNNWPLEAIYVENARAVSVGKTYINPIEARAIIARVQTIIAQAEKKSYPEKVSIGIISMFGQQQHHLIQRELQSSIPPNLISKHKIKVGLPADFQGDERNIILLSLVTAPGHDGRAIQSDDADKRYNVAASRAQDKMIVFHSKPIPELPGGLPQRIATHCQQPLNEITYDRATLDRIGDRDLPPEIATNFRLDVARVLAKATPKIKFAQRIGPIEIHILVETPEGKIIAVICPEPEKLRLHEREELLEQYAILVRAKWDVFLVDKYLFYLDTSGSALAPVINQLRL